MKPLNKNCSSSDIWIYVHFGQKHCRFWHFTVESTDKSPNFWSLNKEKKKKKKTFNNKIKSLTAAQTLCFCFLFKFFMSCNYRAKVVMAVALILRPQSKQRYWYLCFVRLQKKREQFNCFTWINTFHIIWCSNLRNKK